MATDARSQTQPVPQTGGGALAQTPIPAPKPALAGADQPLSYRAAAVGAATEPGRIPLPPAKPMVIGQVAERSQLPEPKPEPPPRPAGTNDADGVFREYMEVARLVSRIAGVSPAEIIAKAARESSFNATARSQTSSAAGPFQFIERTWLDMVRRHGPTMGLVEEARQVELRRGTPVVVDADMRDHILDLRFDIKISAGMAARYLDEAGSELGRLIRRRPDTTERHMAYFLGPGGAAKLIGAAQSNPGGSAAKLMPEAAKANQPLFYQDGRPLTNSGALTKITHFLNRDIRHYTEMTGLSAGG